MWIKGKIKKGFKGSGEADLYEDIVKIWEVLMTEEHQIKIFSH